VNEGTHRVMTLDDDWTVVTQDGKLSAHFEHTVAVTSDGPMILTMDE
jgi:methionyl aminopeptidase